METEDKSLISHSSKSASANPNADAKDHRRDLPPVSHRSARKQSKQRHKDVAVEEYIRGYRRMPESLEEISDAEILGASVLSETLWEGSD